MGPVSRRRISASFDSEPKRQGTFGRCPLRWQDAGFDHLPFRAMRALAGFAAGEFDKGLDFLFLTRKYIEVRNRNSEAFLASGQRFLLAGIAEYAVMAHPSEARREDVLRETPQELHPLEGHLADFAVGPVILVAEPYTVIIDRKETMIGDGSFMSVAPEVFDDLFGASEGLFGVDDPGFLIQLLSPFSQGLCVREAVGQDQFPGLEQSAEMFEKNRLEYAAHGLDGKEEFLSVRDVFPVSPGIESSAREDTMHMGMQHQVLSPGVQDHGSAGFSAQPFFIGCKCSQRLPG